MSTGQQQTQSQLPPHSPHLVHPPPHPNTHTHTHTDNNSLEVVVTGRVEFSTRCVSDVLDLLEPDNSDGSVRGTGVIEPDAAILRAVADARPVLKTTCRVGNILKDMLVKKTKNDSDCARHFFKLV